MKLPTLKSNLILFPFILIFIIFLTVYGIKGWHSRYLADDYCYSYRVNENGFLNNQINSYLTHTEYASNRFAATFFQNAVEKLGGPYFVPYLPATNIILWFLGLFYLSLQIKRLLASKESILITVASSLAILFFALYLAPNLYETLFWLAGMQSYVTPIVLYTILVGRLIVLSKKTSLKSYNILEISLLSFLSCSFSETVALWQITISLIALSFMFFYRNKRTLIARNGLKTFAISFSSMLIAFGIQLACPTNSIRASAFPHPDLITLISKSLFHAKEFIRLSILGKPAPFLALLIFGILIGFLMAKNKQHIKTYVITLLSLNLIGFVLVTEIMAPTMYAMSTYPGGRTLFAAHFTLILVTFLNGWLISNITQQILHLTPAQITTLSFVLGSIILIYSAIRITPHVYKDLEQYQSRAQAWDARHQKILALQQAGERDITIPAFDSVYFIMAIKDKPNAWVNQCAANYYEVESIYATQNYDGVSTFPIGK